MLKMNEFTRKLKYVPAEILYILSGGENCVKEQMKEKIAQNYLKSNYILPYFRSHDIYEIDYQKKIPHICWVYWRQGKDNAPDIVKKCIDSINCVFSNNDWSVNVLDIEWVKRNCVFPQFIWDKYNQGIIKEAQFSDLLRVALLHEYGGCWVDATVFFSDKSILPHYIFDNTLFCYRNYMRNDEHINISNWLLSATQGNAIINTMFDLLLEYWKKENVTIQYYFFHLMFKLVTDYYREYWNKLPIYSNVPPHVLQTELENDFSLNIWNGIIENTCIHKLYWKLPEQISKQSFYEYIINK